MKAFKIVLNYLPFIAIVFAFLYFSKMDVIFDFQKPNLPLVLLSFLLLMMIFFSRAVFWNFTLRKFSIHVSWRTVFVSEFKTILMKYIPGKIWLILGKANIISKCGYSISLCSGISFLLQLITIISGLIVGSFGLLCYQVNKVDSYMVYITLAILAILLLLLTKGVKIFSSKRFKKFIPIKYRSFLCSSLPNLTDIFIFSVIHWFILGYAYFLLFKAVGVTTGFYTILLQPLANNIGVISVFSPGGLAAREGVMIAYLHLFGISIANATTLSVISRLWFFIGEGLIFIIGCLVNQKHNTC